MLFNKVAEILDAEILSCLDKVEKEVSNACASDMMSDVLAFAKDSCLLLTGLLNQQVIRTAEMKDIMCVCFVRDKKPDEAILELAEDKGIIVMRTALRMFEASGRLYAGGLGERGKENG
jgi:predicted transcriptional regulator